MIKTLEELQPEIECKQCAINQKHDLGPCDWHSMKPSQEARQLLGQIMRGEVKLGSYNKETGN